MDARLFPNTFRFVRIDPDGIAQVITQDRRRAHRVVTGASSPIMAPSKGMDRIPLASYRMSTDDDFARAVGATCIVRVKRWKFPATGGEPFHDGNTGEALHYDRETGQKGRIKVTVHEPSRQHSRRMGTSLLGHGGTGLAPLPRPHDERGWQPK
jgi:hypothetical protein